MIGKRNKVKKAGDERLLRILNKILHAKFIFLYEEARRRNTKSSSSSSVITR